MGTLEFLWTLLRLAIAYDFVCEAHHQLSAAQLKMVSVSILTDENRDSVCVRVCTRDYTDFATHTSSKYYLHWGQG